MTYAFTYMGEWETELFNRSEYLPSTYCRYIDEVWGTWIHGEERLLQFVNAANNIHPNIQVELRFSRQTTEFLDVQIS